MNTRTFACLWIAIGVLALALETFALCTNLDFTLSRTLRRAFAHAPWVTLVLFGALAAWLTIHLWAPLLVHATKVTVRVATKYVGKGRR